MTQQQAQTIADILRGKAHHTGGNLWVVEIDLGNGHVVVIGDEAISEYADRASYKAGGSAVTEILL